MWVPMSHLIACLFGAFPPRLRILQYPHLRHRPRAAGRHPARPVLLVSKAFLTSVSRRNEVHVLTCWGEGGPPKNTITLPRTNMEHTWGSCKALSSEWQRRWEGCTHFAITANIEPLSRSKMVCQLFPMLVWRVLEERTHPEAKQRPHPYGNLA